MASSRGPALLQMCSAPSCLFIFALPVPLLKQLKPSRVCLPTHQFKTPLPLSPQNPVMLRVGASFVCSALYSQAGPAAVFAGEVPPYLSKSTITVSSPTPRKLLWSIRLVLISSTYNSPNLSQRTYHFLPYSHSCGWFLNTVNPGGQGPRPIHGHLAGTSTGLDAVGFW